MKRFLILSLLLGTMLSCNKVNVSPEKIDSSVCNVADPINDLTWLKERTKNKGEEPESCFVTSVKQGIYNGQSVFIITAMGNSWLVHCVEPSVYDCSGQWLFSLNSEKGAQIRDQKLIYEKK